MRRRNIQRAGGSSVLGTAADSVEVRVLLSAEPAMLMSDAVPEGVPADGFQPCEDVAADGQIQQQFAEPEIAIDPASADVSVFAEPDDGALVTIAECGFVPEGYGIPFEMPQVVICEPYDPRYVPEAYEWQVGSVSEETAAEQSQGAEADDSQEPLLLAASSGLVGTAGRMAQYIQMTNPVAMVSGAVTAEIELAGSPQYDQDGNLTVPSVLHDRLSGIQYWQPKQVTLQSSTDLTELLQNYGITDYSADEQGVWQIPVSPEYGVELFNLATGLLADQTVRAELWLQPVDGQDAAPLLISLPESQISVSYESSWTDPIWPTGWQNSSVQIQASGAFNGTLEVSEGPLWDDAGQLISAGLLVDVATGVRYQSPQTLTVFGEAIDQLDLLLQDSQWSAGLDTKIISVDVLDAQTRLLQIAPGTGYDVLQLAGRLTEQTGLSCVVRLTAADEGGEDLEISTPGTALFVDYPVYMYSRGSVSVGTPEVQFGEVLTAVADGPVRPDVLQSFGDSVKFAGGVDVPVFAFGGGVVGEDLQTMATTGRDVVREAISQMWLARARQPMSDLVRDVSMAPAADDTLSRVSAIAAAVPTSVGRVFSESGDDSKDTEAAAVLEFSSLNLTTEIHVQPAESVPELELLNQGLRRRQPRPVPPQPQQEEIPVDVPVEQPAVPVAPQSENPAARFGPGEIPVSQSDPAIDSLMAAFAAAGVTH